MPPSADQRSGLMFTEQDHADLRQLLLVTAVTAENVKVNTGNIATLFRLVEKATEEGSSLSRSNAQSIHMLTELMQEKERRLQLIETRVLYRPARKIVFDVGKVFSGGALGALLAWLMRLGGSGGK
jgi:hypothetical protein